MIPVNYITSILTFFSIFCIFAFGQNIMLGYAGLPMLGYMGLVAVGAYTTAILSTAYNLPFIVTLPLSCLMTMLIAFAVGWLFMRGKLAGAYLVVGSIGFNFIVVAILLFAPWFGRMFGIGPIPAPEILGYRFSSSVDFSILGLFFVAIVAYIDRQLSRSALGLGLKALREDGIAAESSGVNTVRLKVLAFILGSFQAGIGGCLYAYYIKSVFPTYFEFVHSVEVFTMVILGGMGTTLGPIVGALVPTLVPEALRGNVPMEARFLIYSIIIIIVVLFEPTGIFGVNSRVRRLLSRLARLKL